MLFAWKLSGIRSDEVSVSCSSMYETLPPPSTSSAPEDGLGGTGSQAPKPRSWDSVIDVPSRPPGWLARVTRVCGVIKRRQEKSATKTVKQGGEHGDELQTIRAHKRVPHEVPLPHRFHIAQSGPAQRGPGLPASSDVRRQSCPCAVGLLERCGATPWLYSFGHSTCNAALVRTVQTPESPALPLPRRVTPRNAK